MVGQQVSFQNDRKWAWFMQKWVWLRKFFMRFARIDIVEPPFKKSCIRHCNGSHMFTCIHHNRFCASVSFLTFSIKLVFPVSLGPVITGWLLHNKLVSNSLFLALSNIGTLDNAALTGRNQERMAIVPLKVASSPSRHQSLNPSA